MPSARFFTVLAALILWLAAAPAARPANEPSGTKKAADKTTEKTADAKKTDTKTDPKADSKDSKAAAEAAPAGEEELDLSLVPAGQPVKGIKIPYYAADGVTLQMVFEAGTARRIDDENIEMENLKITGDSDDGRKFSVEFPRSLFNIDKRMLTGDQGVVISREDFEITGKAAEFDIKTRNGKVLGNVKMIILSTEGFEQ